METRRIICILILCLSAITTTAQRSYIEYWTTRHLRNTEGDIAILPDGNIIAYYSRFYGGSVDSDGSEIYAKISTDSGRNWKPLQIAQENIGAQNVMSVSVLNEPGKLWLFFCVKNSVTDLQVWVKTSNDNGDTWTSPSRLFTAAGYWTLNNNRVIRTSSGRLIVPVARIDNVNQAFSVGLTSSVWYSDDEGTTWTESNRLSVGNNPSGGLQEPGVVELSPGNLLMYIRVNNVGKQYFASSIDDGTTWSAPYESTLNSPLAPAKIIKLSDGRLLACHNNNSVSAARRPLSLSVSSDDGTTWTEKKILSVNPNAYYAYPSMIEHEGEVWLTYWEQLSRTGLFVPFTGNVFSLVFEKIPLTDLN